MTLNLVVHLSQLLLALVDLLFVSFFAIFMRVSCMISLLCKCIMGLLLLTYHMMEVVWLSYQVSLLLVLLLGVVKNLAWLILLHVL